MNKKVLGITIAFLIAAILATPLVSAVPGAEKSNEKFEFFELFCSGEGSPIWSRNWPTFRNDTVKTRHVRDREWLTGDTVNLTVGEKTFNMTSEPFSISYATTIDNQVGWNNDGTIRHYCIKLIDVVTLYEDDVEIGTLVLKIKALIDFTGGMPPRTLGKVVGYGTGALEGIHVSATDPGGLGGGLFKRTGTITGWPEEITNI